jgi:hypothetical protein
MFASYRTVPKLHGTGDIQTQVKPKPRRLCLNKKNRLNAVYKMSSWTRDMAKKPPTAAAETFAPTPFSAPVTQEAPPLMRNFPSLVTNRQQQQQQSNARNNFILEPFVPPPVAVPVFENTSRLNSSRPTQQAKKTPEPWAPLDKVVKKKENNPAPKVKQLDKPSSPEVTVLIDVNNDITFLSDFLQSLVRQTFTKWVSVLGLRSSDDDLHKRIVETIVKLQMENLVAITVLPDTLTENESFMELAKVAQTPYLALARRSDLWVSKKLEKQLEAVKKDKNLGLVGTMSRLFGDKVELVNVPPGRLNISDFTDSNPVVFSSVLIKSDLLDFTKEFNSFDYDSWIRLNQNGADMVNLTDILTLQRVSNQVERRKEDRDDVKAKYGL